MVQFQRKGNLYGSQENNGELRLASLESILQIDSDARMQADHYTALVMMNELDKEILENLVDKKEVGGLVIIIPSTVNIENVVWLLNEIDGTGEGTIQHVLLYRLAASDYWFVILPY